MENMKIGFIGLGEMGKPMAGNLLKNHFKVTVCGHRRRGPVEELTALKAVEAASPQEVAAASDVVIVMVRDIAQTDDVFWGRGGWEGRGIWQGVKAGSAVIICSTLTPGYCRDLAEKAGEKGVAVIDSPVSGGYPAAEAGTLTFMVGGEREAVERCRPVFKGMGENIYYLGGPGSGQAMKLINNYMMVVTVFGTSEAIALGLKAGLELERMLDVIRVSSGNSAVIGHWNILAASQQAHREADTAGTSIFKKDVGLAMEFAREIGVDMDFGRLVLQTDESHLFPTESP